MDNNVREEMGKIEIPSELHHRIQLGVEKAQGEMKQQEPVSLHEKRLNRKWNLKRKVTYIAGTCILLFGLLIGSAFASPAIAAVVSKLPVIGLVVPSTPLIGEISEELGEHQYNLQYIDVSIKFRPEKMIELTIDGPSGYYHENKEGITSVMERFLQEKEYDAFRLKVNKLDRNEDIQPTAKQRKEVERIEGKVTNVLKEKQIDFNLIEVDPIEKTVRIDVAGSEDYYNEVKASIEQTLTEENTKYKILISTVGLTKQKVNPENEVGIAVIPKMSQVLMSKKEYHVTGIAYKEEPLTFFIKTSIESTDSNAKEFGKHIEKDVKSFLQSDEIAPVIQNTQYEIVVYNKKKKKIN